MDYLDKLKHLHSRPDNGSIFEAGSQIYWDRAGTMQTGVVEYLYTDAVGGTWAFVAVGGSWSAVNLKFAQRVSP